MNRRINEHTVLKNIDTVPFVAFDALEGEKELVCGFSTRLGGVSTGIFASMNLGFARGDDEENVFENYRRICASMEISPEQLILPEQVHGINVRISHASDGGKGIFRERDYKEIDAQITNERGAALMVFGADCVPIFFYDAKKHAIGTAHAGWRGTSAKIAAVTVQKMQEAFGCVPADIRAVIGPSIGAECYEVSSDVADVFLETFAEQAFKIPEVIDGFGNTADAGAKFPILTPYSRSLSGKGEQADAKYRLNLWEANRQVLLGVGLCDKNITVSGLCTMCRQDLFFSHRATNGKRGSMAGFMMLKA